jgi:peptidoglycan/xylan/chitin deacetylase (PgdA/CDA1 family)
LHGYTHEYRELNGRWVGEFGWKPSDQLLREVAHGRAYLEQVLNTEVRVFVPPSNTISKDGVRAIRSAGLWLSGAMGRGGDRPWTWDYPYAYIRRWAWRALHGQTYPFPLTYGGHSELRAYTLTPRSEADQLFSALRKCGSIGAPFVLATHYWEFEQAPSMHETLRKLVDMAADLGMPFGFVSQCFGDS